MNADQCSLSKLKGFALPCCLAPAASTLRSSLPLALLVGLTVLSRGASLPLPTRTLPCADIVRCGSTDPPAGLPLTYSAALIAITLDGARPPFTPARLGALRLPEAPTADFHGLRCAAATCQYRLNKG